MMHLPNLRGPLSAFAALLAFPAMAHAGTFKTIYTFSGNSGVAPEAALIYENGALYGTTSQGGPSSVGTVFSFDVQTGVESVLTTSMGSLPFTPVLAVGGKLYGTTSAGDNGDGNIYDFDLKTTATKDLYAFPRGRDQAYPGALVKVGGNLYGTTYNGGSSDNGSVFQYDLKTAAVTTEYSFSGGADGKNPMQLMPKGGFLYGVATRGGANGLGAIFKLNVATNAETTVHSFAGTTDGSQPNGIVFHQGLIYGTASYGGANGYGTLFTLDISTGAVSVLYNLVGGAEGCTPIGQPAIYKGHLYDVAASCGSDANQGTLFDVKLSTGKEKTLHVFANGADGVSPGAGLLLNQGVLYGTASFGGANNAGTIFEYVP